MRRTLWTVAPAVALVPLLCGAAPAVAAATSTGDVTVTDTESVQVHLDATGSLQDARVFDQLAFSGTGTATVRNPVSTSGLRNLDGFRGWKVEDGAQVATVDVDGERRLRSMSDYDKDLPLSVKVTYRLDGKDVKPGDVVGRTGTLEVHYVVENLTAKTEPVSYADGKGGTATADATTVVPMIGELVTVLPPSFTAVTSAEAAIGGDGRGGTQLQFQMTLFPPIGSAKAEFGYTAHVSKGIVPKATMTALPVSPLDFPSYKDGSATIKAGGEQGVALTSGAVQIDANLVKLHDGAAQLLAGLAQLKDGADQLHSGLTDKLSPGADQLASALNGKLAPGATRLADGLADGSKDFPQLSGGAKTLFEALNEQLAPGSAELADGLGAGASAMPQFVDGADKLSAGLASAAGQAPGLTAGVQQLSAGLANLDGGLATLSTQLGSADTQDAATSQLHAGIAALKASVGSASQLTIPGSNPVVPTLYGGVAQLGASANGALAEVNASLDTISTTIGTVQGYLGKVDTTGLDPTSTAYLGYATGTLAGLKASVDDRTDLQTQAAALTAGIASLKCAISRTAGCTSTSPTLAEALGGIDQGIDTMVAALVKHVTDAIGSPAAAGTVRNGVAQLSAGTTALAAGAAPLVAGLGELSAGATALDKGAQGVADGLTGAAIGSAALADGLSAAADGSGRLSAGVADAQSKVDDAVSGSKKLADGTHEAATGSSQLASGLHDAADGSGDLADGLGKTTDEATGAPALVAGAQKLHDEGTSQVVASGEETAASFGTQYAVLEANAKRAQTEGMAYGAPEGAAGATAYSIEIAGADGSGSKALGLGAAGVALFGIGAGVATLVRRRIV